MKLLLKNQIKEVSILEQLHELTQAILIDEEDFYIEICNKGYHVFNGNTHHFTDDIHIALLMLNNVKRDIVGASEKEEAINRLNSLNEDCRMAIQGHWDCSSDEGKEGFNAMIDSIDRIKKIINKNM